MEFSDIRWSDRVRCTERTQVRIPLLNHASHMLERHHNMDCIITHPGRHANTSPEIHLVEYPRYRDTP